MLPVHVLAAGGPAAVGTGRAARAVVAFAVLVTSVSGLTGLAMLGLAVLGGGLLTVSGMLRMAGGLGRTLGGGGGRDRERGRGKDELHVPIS
jgi:hypothetical protein